VRDLRAGVPLRLGGVHALPRPALRGRGAVAAQRVGEGRMERKAVVGAGTRGGARRVAARGAGAVRQGSRRALRRKPDDGDEEKRKMDPITKDDTVRRDWEREKEDVAQLAEDATVKAGQAAGRVAGEAQRRLRSASDRAAAAYDRTASQARRAY